MPALFKILQIGDLHLGKKSYGLTERIRDHAAVLPQIAAYARRHRPDLVCLLGDVFDSPNPDSLSCDIFRRFVASLTPFSEFDCPVLYGTLALTGNHDRERLDLGMTRVRSLGGDALLPHVIDEEGPPAFRLRAFDWMPTAAIARELEALPDGIDILCIHQSVEGLKPEIGEPEVRLEQLRGKARLVLAGDVHVNRSVDAGEGTTVISAGSTEMCASDEDPQKVVKLVTYDAEARTVVSVEDLPLRTREHLHWDIVNDQEFERALGTIDTSALEPDPERLLHFAIYAPEFAHRLPELERAAAAHGDLIVATPMAATVELQTFADSKLTSEREFEEVLAARHEEQAERECVLGLWRNPGQAAAILAAL